MDIDRVAHLVQVRFWLFAIPYMLLSPFIFYFVFRAPPAPAQRVMPIVFIDANGQTKKMFCGADDANEMNMLALSEKTARDMMNSFFSFPSDKKKTAARIATFSKYFSQDSSSLAQFFLKSQAEKILSLSNSGAEATFSISDMKSGFDEKKKEYVVIVDATQKMVRNGIETTQNYFVDVYLKVANKERRESESVILEITNIKIRNKKNEG